MLTIISRYLLQYHYSKTSNSFLKGKIFLFHPCIIIIICGNPIPTTLNHRKDRGKSFVFQVLNKCERFQRNLSLPIPVFRLVS